MNNIDQEIQTIHLYRIEVKKFERYKKYNHPQKSIDDPQRSANKKCKACGR